ncbi:MAG: methionyl-tRNA formyltransferase [Candidatus Ryanbacteria bacterium RIFCSPHIGHO2_02_FULL_45_43]|uniref:Methionyl-tRNA formyltransferase n=1 Tax=Candidatus Ryanbacteria bacterium RIFCSPHIGHO2_01_45_13 TaxID=1802112 RepID=A0A1G2FY53_9BACT|nr:MAG: methionyl-tRNA formyltransferase [Candidatus Ryanbacteria bacterium RIFCSPHIGHO2_01_FULL_44_130]OGZ42996.1 MAG: methionyl-tRNA formyltransferase [Candidatus Ryanbacteria bacterium RIFCSPHIGHO2_01_45_13]OGZ48701.1 MAG: methionyl-tRNA formyltransferase [Candidatus Ryanbacteria bacterium RIFCSPHIGHO2_02_FULL_45_43]OGZ50641.1 MAG: methionyl-tRNA formyltransferase [Candidatus Ryanbacteria bacterium RIFCSPHIGHO2_12_FULL_44_20]OGZ51947.1 MAG: methionyl-tRNA formyltransferase [Candidatus Ryanba
MTKRRIVFFGTPNFAVTILEFLQNTDIRPLLIITAPDKARGRGKKILPTPVKTWALIHNIEVAAPEVLNDQLLTNKLVKIKPELFIVAAYGKILKKNYLQIPSEGVLNIHPSLLPKYRGAAPIQGALLHGEKETGVTIILMDEQMDHGPILAQEKINILEEDDSVTLSHKLAGLGGKLLIETISSWFERKITPLQQNHKEATFTKSIDKSEGKIDWQKEAEAIVRYVKAYKLWPISWSVLNINGKKIRIKILKAKLADDNSKGIKAGTLIKKNGDMYVATKDVFLRLDELQPEGRKAMPGRDFMRGLPLSSADKPLAFDT